MKKNIFLILILITLSGVVWSQLNPPATETDRPQGEASPDDATPGQVIEHFKLEGFEANGLPFWELTGDYAHVGLATDIFIERNVKLKIQDTLVDTDKVFWQQAKSRLITNQTVKIIHEKQVIEGIGALAKVDEGFLQINRNIGMALKGPIVITCRGPLKIYRKENQVIFYRNVVVRDEQGTLHADRLDVFFDDKTRVIKKIIASDNVRIARDGDVSYSDQAIYNTETQSVRLVGEPKIEMNRKGYSFLDKIS